MKLGEYILLFVLFLLPACNNANKDSSEEHSDSDLDAARNFLQAALKGDYKTASAYMLPDSTNLGYLAVTQRSYQNLSHGERDSLRTASLRFFDTQELNDSTTVTIFANSYRNDRDTLRIVKRQGAWLVDLKYLFDHDMDTLGFRPRNKVDTIHK